MTNQIAYRTAGGTDITVALVTEHEERIWADGHEVVVSKPCCEVVATIRGERHPASRIVHPTAGACLQFSLVGPLINAFGKAQVLAPIPTDHLVAVDAMFAAAVEHRTRKALARAASYEAEQRMYAKD